MKFRGHETFFIRKGWLYKGMSNVYENSGAFLGDAGNPMDIFGIGANMVKALRYWLTATGLAEEPKSGKRVQTLTDVGQIIFENDPYMEEIGSLWLVHYKLVSNEEEATSWYILFNTMTASEFRLDDFERTIIKYVRMKGEALPSSRVVEEDFNCIINTYVSRSKLFPEKIHPENNIDCPLGELGLLDIVNKHERLYRKVSPKLNTIPLLIALAIIIDNAEGGRQIRITDIQNDDCNIGKAFNLDSISLIALLYQLDQAGYLKVVRTAGLDVINITTDMTFIDCVKAYYEELNNL